MKRIAIAAAAVLAAAFLFILFLLPPKRLTLPAATWPAAARVAVGVIHVHTRQSDGSGTAEEVAAAAARAGLNFVIFTDHGDGTGVPIPPTYRSGVLCINAVEISTAQGHFLALGLPRSPYPLGGDPRDVIQDVTRLGGFGIVAHPDSRKPALQWHNWDTPVEGLEWLNADSEWRDERRLHLARAALTYPFRPVETLGALLDGPDATLQRWDLLTRLRRVVAVAGTDAHARVGWQDDDAEGYRRTWFLRLPSYEVSFRAFALRVNLAGRFTGDAAPDAARLLEALRDGHVYTGIDAIATPAVLDFTASNADGSVEQGDRLVAGGRVIFRARVNALEGGTIVLRKDGNLLVQHSVPDLNFETSADPGVYRIDVFLASSPGQPLIPWIVSNPIYVEPDGWDRPTLAVAPPAPDYWNIQGGPWHAEHDSASSTSIRQDNPPRGTVSMSFQLAGGPRQGQYGALVMASGNALTGHDGFSFTAQAAGPMRVSLQARRPSGARWQRSVYVDGTPRRITVPFAEMTPVGDTAAAHFAPADIDTVLFVVDTTNTAPGTQGRFDISDLQVEH